MCAAATTLRGHTNNVHSVCLSPCGNYLATGSYDKTAKIFSMASGAAVKTLSGHTDAVTSVCFSPCGKYLATCSEDATVRGVDSEGPHRARELRVLLAVPACPALCLRPRVARRRRGWSPTTQRRRQTATRPAWRREATALTATNSTSAGAAFSALAAEPLRRRLRCSFRARCVFAMPLHDWRVVHTDTDGVQWVSMKVFRPRTLKKSRL